MRRGSALFAVLTLITAVTLGPAAYAQEETPRFFDLNLPEDELANAAMDQVTEGMSLIITALNAGKKNKVTADPEIAGRAMRDFDQARQGLTRVGLKIDKRKINVDYIRKSQYAKAYDELIIALREARYPEPTDGKSFLGILDAIIEKCMGDLKQLEGPPPANAVAIFLDLIRQKILLERIGSTSLVVTRSMQ